ncbi:hypothetical protein HLV38_05095 [Berryella wangjianweii]|uniref:Uncharacterized protein n=1 Tax=Berryella wangjianweii TaxID=2734634 RepID=A0A6M8J343_9ACTN|nr:hypothetical protein [Berryella wangjianweii]QKF07561.1 hypothetical protein HLV38_05095 [Berryella wangjianweii]
MSNLACFFFSTDLLLPFILWPFAALQGLSFYGRFTADAPDLLFSPLAFARSGV